MRQTPLEFLPHFSEVIGREIWIKRDDCNGDILTAGNKQRKITYLLQDAQAQGAEIILTSGGPQSNHARAMGALSIKAGLTPLLVLGGREPEQVTGNYLLNKLLGVEMLFTGAKTQEEMGEALFTTAQKLKAAGRKTYLIPVGGSNGLGTFSYVEAYREMKQQSQDLDFHWLFVSAGSGGTMAGLTLGKWLHGDQTQIVGISPWLKKEEIEAKVWNCVQECLPILKQEPSLKLEEIQVADNYIGEGYGLPTKEGRKALNLLARTEAILLDYVYTSKTMAGCLDYIRKGIVKPGERVLFWHTGGAPSIFT